MKNLKKVLGGGLALTLILSQGVAAANAKGIHQKKADEKVDKNKDGLPDKWEKKYKLSGKNIAKKDNDKDGLSNLTEYRLNLNPTSKDTDKDRIPDGLEDSYHDQLSNIGEIALGTNPASADSDHDKVKDGSEKGKNGVKLSKEILDFELSLVSSKKTIEVDYSLENKTLKTKNLNHGQYVSLVNHIENAKKLTEAQLLSIIQDKFHLECSYTINAKVDFVNGQTVEINKEITATENQNEDQNGDLEDGQGDSDQKGDLQGNQGDDDQKGDLGDDQGEDNHNGRDDGNGN